MEIKLSISRHMAYMLGNTQAESLENCNKYDAAEGDMDKLELIGELLDKCTDERRKKYVYDLANKP